MENGSFYNFSWPVAIFYRRLSNLGQMNYNSDRTDAAAASCLQLIPPKAMLYKQYRVHTVLIQLKLVWASSSIPVSNTNTTFQLNHWFAELNKLN